MIFQKKTSEVGTEMVVVGGCSVGLVVAASVVVVVVLWVVVEVGNNGGGLVSACW